MNDGIKLASVLGLFTCVVAYAGDSGISSMSANQMGWYGGFGGSYNWMSNDYQLSAVLNAQTGAIPLGIFTGSTGHYTQSYANLTPQIQVGYFNNFPASSWLWGMELRYQFSSTRANQGGQGGDYEAQVNVYNAQANTNDLIHLGQRQTKIDGELFLPVYLGQTFTQGFVYLGAGPALFNTTYHNTSWDNDSAFYLGHLDASHDKSVWGALVQVAAACYLNSDWYLKLDYTYARSRNYSLAVSDVFTVDQNGGLNNGVINYAISSRVTTQQVALSINKVFA